MASKRARVKNASDEKQVRRAEVIEKLLADQLAADVHEILSTAAGVRFFAALLEEWKAWGPLFSSDALWMAFNAGQRESALKLVEMVDSVPGAMALVLAERMRRENMTPPSKPEPEHDDDE